MFGGGIVATFNLRTTFSQISASGAGFAGSIRSRLRPPVLIRSLWQLTQYLSRSCRLFALADDGAAGDPADCCAEGSAGRHTTSAATRPDTATVSVPVN